MVNLLSDALPDEALTGAGAPTHYEAGGGRKTFFALLFIILLPFFVSVPAMLYQRVERGVWLDTWGLILIAVAFLAIMILILFELIFSLRTSVDLGERALSFTLPRGSGLLPTLFYETRTIPYEDIEAVQTYCDHFGGRVAPMVLRGTRLVLKTKETVVLGFVNDRDDDPRFPFPRIGAQIAQRAGLNVKNLGHIQYALHRRMFGITSERPDDMPEDVVQAINKRHRGFLLVLSLIFLVLLGLGIVGDLQQGSGQLGELGILHLF